VGQALTTSVLPPTETSSETGLSAEKRVFRIESPEILCW